MRSVNWKLWVQKARPFKAPMLVVAVSALLALLFTFATQPSADSPRAAGEASILLVEQEHALVADLVRDIQVGVEAERLAAQRIRAEMRERALAEAVKPDTQVATATAPQDGLRRVALPLPKPAQPVEAPLQLQVAASPPQPPDRPTSKAQATLATVQKIPGWLRAGVANVADWAMTVPSKAISQLPERRFL